MAFQHHTLPGNGISLLWCVRLSQQLRYRDTIEFIWCHNASRHSHWTLRIHWTVYTRNNVTLRTTFQDGFEVHSVVYWQPKLTCTKHSFDMHQSVTDLAGAGTRLYNSPAQAELHGYATNKVGYCRPLSSEAFRAQRTGEPESLLCFNETSDLINQSIKSSFVKGAGAHPQNAPCRRRSHALKKAPVRRGRLLSTVFHRWSPRQSILSAGLR